MADQINRDIRRKRHVTNTNNLLAKKRAKRTPKITLALDDGTGCRYPLWQDVNRPTYEFCCATPLFKPGVGYCSRHYLHCYQQPEEI